jgi:hypothetical protein
LLSARDDGSLDAFAPMAGDAPHVEYGYWHEVSITA